MYVFPGYSLCFLTVWNFLFRKTVSHWIRKVYLNVVSSLTQFLLLLAPFSENKYLLLIWFSFSLSLYGLKLSFPALTKNNVTLILWIPELWISWFNSIYLCYMLQNINLHIKSQIPLNVKVIISEVLLKQNISLW